MSKPVRVPIRVRHRSGASNQELAQEQQAVTEPEPTVVEREPVANEAAEQPAPAPPRIKEDSAQLERVEVEAPEEDLETWRDRALRLQAELENFRKRQRRLAEERIQANRARLLRNFLTIADDLERALNAEGADHDRLQEGVKMTHRSLMQSLRQEGVETIDAQGEVFDPTWHEAIAAVPHEEAGVDQDTVAGVAQQGYRLDGRLLRPAQVVVAK